MGFVVGLSVLTIAFLAAQAGSLFVNAEGIVPTHKALSALSVAEFPATLLLDLALFSGVVLALHGLVVVYALIVRRFFLKRLGWRADRAEGAAFLVFLACWSAMMLWNGILFPRSHLAMSLVSDRVDLVAAVVALLLTAVPLVLLLADALARFVLMSPGRVVAVAVVASLGAIPLVLPSQDPGAVAESPAAPNVIFIGVDSLRPEYVLAPELQPLMPNLTRVVSRAATFEEAITPLGRTYPSWMSILSGRYPVQSGARINLSDPAWVDRSGLLSEALQKEGYRTVLAIDERRFSNIDESYGFDEIVGPEVGAADFVMGLAADLPILNLLSATPVARHMLPFVYANRAVATTYRPSVFNRELVNALSNRHTGQPLFLAVHYCLPHWPYHWAAESDYETREAHGPRELASLRRGLYEEALGAVDDQVGHLLETLQQNGYLDDALVVVLSDHGESFGPDDPSIPVGDVNSPVFKHTVGHGTNVFVPSQHRILLGFTGTGRFGFSPGRRTQPAATLDIFPTVAELLGLQAPERVDGLSLAPWLSDMKSPLQERHFFIETGFNVPALSTVDFNLEKLLEQGAAFYRIDEVGRLVVDHQFRQKILDGKQLAVTNGRFTVGAVPVEGGTRVWYVSDLESGRVWQLDDTTRESCNAECRGLLARLAQFYSDDLSPSGHAFVAIVQEAAGTGSVPALAVSDEHLLHGLDATALAAADDAGATDCPPD